MTVMRTSGVGTTLTPLIKVGSWNVLSRAEKPIGITIINISCLYLLIKLSNNQLMIYGR
jgi:hypothetical protein